MASSKRSAEITPQAVVRLRAVGVKQRLRTSRVMVAKGVGQRPLVEDPEQREANFQASLEAKQEGLECASCGHIRRVSQFVRYDRGRKSGLPSEWEAVCMVCEAELEKAELHAAQRDRAAVKATRGERRELARKSARNRAILQRRGARESAAARKASARRRKVLETGSPEVQRELLARELCRRNFVRFVQRFEGLELVGEEERDRLRQTGRGLHLGWFHRFVLDRLQRFLQDLVDGKEPRLMLFTPPRHGKSTMASRLLPAYALGCHPWMEIIAASYGSALPLEFSRFVRATLQDKAYRAIFNHTVLLEDKQQLTGWGTTQGGQYLPAGVGTGISGRGAHLLLIDDPVKDMDEADSETIQQRNLEWYLSTSMNRLAPRCGQLIIQTRWSDNDISGYLERGMNEALREINEAHEEEAQHIRATIHNPQQRGLAMMEIGRRREQELDLVEQWEIIRFPALATQDEYITEDLRLVHAPEEGAKLVRREGDPLHPERYSERRLQRIRRTMQRQGKERIWLALYQQTPAEGSSLHFKADMFPTEPSLPPYNFAHWTILQVWDPAIGERQQNDFTVGGTAALDPFGRLHVLHVQRFRGGAAEIAARIISEYETYEDMCAAGVYALGIEHGQISMALEDSLQFALEEANRERRRTGKDELHHPPYLVGDRALKPVTDKLVRARPSQGWHRSGRVLYPADAPWRENLVAEHTGFMAGAQFDDCVDFMSWMVRVARQSPLPRKGAQEALGRRYGRYRTLSRRIQEQYRSQKGGKSFMAA